MSQHIALIWKKLAHLERMREYLRYSMAQVSALLPIKDWQALQPDQHETLAAFRIRFSAPIFARAPTHKTDPSRG